jgi:hypothetical protein
VYTALLRTSSLLLRSCARAERFPRLTELKP